MQARYCLLQYRRFIPGRPEGRTSISPRSRVLRAILDDRVADLGRRTRAAVEEFHGWEKNLTEITA
jgi:hypothetical protein